MYVLCMKQAASLVTTTLKQKKKLVTIVGGVDEGETT